MHTGAKKLTAVIVGLLAILGGAWLDELARDNRGSELGPVLLAGSLILMIGGLIAAAWFGFSGRLQIMEFVRNNRAAQKCFAILSMLACAAGIGSGGYLLMTASTEPGALRAEGILIGGGLFLGWWGLKLLAMRPAGVSPDDRGGGTADSA